MIPKVTDETLNQPIDFSHPHKLERDPKSGHVRPNLDKSEEFVLLEAVGTPKVFYAKKQNKYFKDEQCTKEYSNEELERLELPRPFEIEAARRKLIKAANDAGQPIDMAELRSATAPQMIQPPVGIRERIITVDPVERIINRINRSTLGK